MKAMRSIARALVSVILVVCCSPTVVVAESTGSRWWPFGHHDDANAAQPSSLGTAGSTPLATPRTSGAPTAPLASQPELPKNPADAEPTEHWMFKSRKGKVGWPHLTKPQAPTTGLSSGKAATADTTRNSWVTPAPTPPKPSPLKPITDGAHKVAQGTKNAWHKTVEALTPGASAPTRSNSSPRIAQREVNPPFWKRMFGAEPEPQGSQTIPGFIAQQRLDP
jgi:hypothetical protein